MGFWGLSAIVWSWYIMVRWISSEWVDMYVVMEAEIAINKVSIPSLPPCGVSGGVSGKQKNTHRY